MIVSNTQHLITASNTDCLSNAIADRSTYTLPSVWCSYSYTNTNTLDWYPSIFGEHTLSFSHAVRATSVHPRIKAPCEEPTPTVDHKLIGGAAVPRDLHFGEDLRVLRRSHDLANGPPALPGNRLPVRE